MGEGRPRTSLGRVVLAGLSGGTLAAVAGNQAWVSFGDSGSADIAFATSGASDLTAPPVTATALVLLASWGVVLVTRGGFRRAVAWLGLVAAVGVLGFAAAAWLARPGEVEAALPTLDLDVARTWWSHVGVLAAAAGVVASLAAVRAVGSWPEMGRRYDAPAATPARSAPDAEQESIELWKALDEGRDPTDVPDH